jgi:hypothetical protein
MGKDYIKNLEKLKEIGELGEGWYNKNSEPFDGEIINNVKFILDNIVIQPEIFPAPDSSFIQLEYDGENDSYLEIEVYKAHLEVFIIHQDSSKEDIGLGVSDIDRLNSIIESFKCEVKI